MKQSLLRTLGMVPVLATFAFCISGLALLLPASPAWVSAGGANATGAGLVTAVLMAATVATQVLVVQKALDRFGWAATLTAGSLFMGLPSPLQAISPDLWLVLFSSALRGVGFGILTVCCSTALTRLVPSNQRGRAVGYYGLAAAIPQLLFTPLSPWIAQTLGFRFVLCAGVIAALGAPFAWRLGALVDSMNKDDAATVQTGAMTQVVGGSVLPIIWPALLTLTLATAAGGALMTFASEIAQDASAASLALLVMMAVAVPTRLYGGTLTDRWGTRITMAPVLALNAAGVAALGFASISGSAMDLMLAALLTGTGYGFLQSVTMVRALSDAPASKTTAASVAWNANYDLGTGLGGIALGALASGFGFANAWWIWAAAMMAAALLLGVRDFKR